MFRRLLFVVVIASASLAQAAQTPKATRKAEAKRPAEERVTRTGTTHIELEGSDIKGQVNRSGAVYLREREELPVRSLVRQRSSFRDQIVRDVLSE